MTRAIAGSLAVVFVGAGIYLAGESIWIHAKAAVAQYLIGAAWTERLAGAAAPRPWPWADMSPLGVLEVPARGVRQIVLSGASGRNLAFGPVHISGSSQPGAPGTTVLGGHRDTHFAFLEDLAANDRLTLTDATGTRSAYRVIALEVADARTTEVRLGTGNDLVLVTCYPFDAVEPGGPLRYVVTAVAENAR